MADCFIQVTFPAHVDSPSVTRTLEGFLPRNNQDEKTGSTAAGQFEDDLLNADCVDQLAHTTILCEDFPIHLVILYISHKHVYTPDNMTRKSYLYL
jgi:hypothetical protein